MMFQPVRKPFRPDRAEYSHQPPLMPQRFGQFAQGEPIVRKTGRQTGQPQQHAGQGGKQRRRPDDRQ